MHHIASFAPMFITIIESGSFTLAAKSLNVSKSYLSEQVKALENELQTTLLHRTTRSLSLTDAGKAYYQQCKKLSEWKRETEEIITNSNHTITGLLKITSVQAFADYQLHDVIHSFTSEYPDIQVELIANNTQSNILNEEFDIAIRLTENPPEHLIAKKLMDVGYICCTSRKFFQTHAQPKTPSDLKNLNCATTPETHSWSFANKEHKIDQEISGNLITSSNHLFRQLALQGTHIIYVPTYAVEKELTEGLLIQLLPEWKPLSRPLFLIYPQQKETPLKIKKFIQYLTVSTEQLVKTQRSLNI